MTITENWQEVERWLSAHAPKVLASLPKGASAKALAEAEKVLGLALPQDLRESLAVHDGSAETFAFYGPNDILLGKPLSAKEVVASWCSLEFLAGGRSESFKGVKRFWWNRKWVPILRVVGDYTCIDLDPAKGGKAGASVRLGP